MGAAEHAESRSAAGSKMFEPYIIAVAFSMKMTRDNARGRKGCLSKEEEDQWAEKAYRCSLPSRMAQGRAQVAEELF